MVSAELLIHPVRLRIVQSLLGGREMTTADLRAELPDVAVATLYRQVATLAEAGLLEIVEERKVRGTAERTYRLRAEQASVGPEEASVMSVDDHRRAFTVFMAGLLGDFDRYLARGTPDPRRISYRQNAFWLTDEEADSLIEDLRAALNRRASNNPVPGRSRRLFSTIIMPAAEQQAPAPG